MLASAKMRCSSGDNLASSLALMADGVGLWLTCVALVVSPSLSLLLWRLAGRLAVRPTCRWGMLTDLPLELLFVPVVDSVAASAAPVILADSVDVLDGLTSS